MRRSAKRISKLSAFTLIELVMSTAIFAVLLGGVTAGLFIASRAVPGEEDATFVVVESARVADRIADELKSATWIREYTAAAITFTVPDRNGDDVPERIRYAWSGTAGDPLTRSYNGATAVDVVESVESFDLDYTATTTSEIYPGPLVESAEALLAGYETPVNSQDYTIRPTEWLGQYFTPALATGAVAWKVTRVQVRAVCVTPKDGITAVQLRLPAAGNLPSTTVLEEQLMSEADLDTSYAWTEFSYSNVSGLDPNTGLCLTLVEHQTDDVLAAIEYDGNAGWNRLQTASGEPGWTIDTTEAMLYRVYGTYSSIGPDQTATREYVTGVRITLQPTADAGSEVVTSAYLLNKPELLAGLWELDFETDPTLDHNGDGTTDWSQRGGGVFNTAELVGGAWQADTKLLDSAPTNDFTALTIAEATFRSTSVTGEGAILSMNVDWGLGRCASLKVSLRFDGVGSQVLTVSHKTDAVTDTALLSETLATTDFVTVRLLIDPDLDTVNVKVDGADFGTFTYARIVPAATEKFVTIGVPSGTAEFDAVSVRVAEDGVGGVVGGGTLD